MPLLLRKGIKMRDYLFTSESVSEGHPDKVADQISDTVLDYLLEEDSASRVACETLVNTGLVVLSGEITSNRSLDGVTERVRETIKEIGYVGSEMGFDYRSCCLLYTSPSPRDQRGSRMPSSA